MCDEGRPPVGEVRDAVGAVTIDDVRAHASRALEGCRALLHVHGAVDESDVVAVDVIVVISHPRNVPASIPSRT